MLNEHLLLHITKKKKKKIRRKRVDEGKVSHFREVEICSAGMPRHCSAGGCKSRDNRETRNAGITFHKLPKGRTRRNLWINNSHRADSWDPQTDFVYFCSKHFTPESFELTGCSGIRRLKEDAFPTVFESSSTIKFKRARTQQKQEDDDRKSPCRTGQEADQGQTIEEPKVPKVLVANEESHENIPASPQDSSRMEQLPKQELFSSSPQSESRPPSPSRYMRRLPPPPGSYLSKEHSYAQLCPVLWRRRYDQAIDCLERALRQLHAARRRENRLRSTVLRLRDKRLKQTLFVSRDRTAGGDKGQRKGGCNQEESETDVKAEDTGLFEDRCVDNSELGAWFLPDSWSEEERGYCLYCGRGQVQVGGQVLGTLSKTGEYVQPTDHDDSLKIQRNVETSTWGPDENTRGIQIVRLERPLRKNVETSGSQVLLHGPSLQHAIPARMCLPDTHEQRFQLLESEQKLLLSDMCRGEDEAVSQEHHVDLQQFVMQGRAEGQLILVPVPDENELQSFLKMEEDTDELQTVFVSDHNESGHLMENNGALTRSEAACEAEHSDHDSVVSSTLVERREDVREKLKEHLEGFHLQLSSEFVN
ncbi:hypothetical protein Q5P01_017935 [Channa striata]|uniref:THAP-type domain-containing protein n=1 Tax=Channa striata TaxID=64152 RepID=A0AA88SFC7_CHASR|nr:hypothetical protein Q5P01_017935 [Channa striata]